MKRLAISDPEIMAMALQDEIRRSEESRYDHRLHGVLLVAKGMSCGEAAGLLGDSPRSVEYWVHRFEERGFGGLQEGTRSGRPRSVREEDLGRINLALRESPRSVGLDANLWDGPLLRAWLRKDLGVDLSVRGCQRLFRELNFRLRKPRPEIAPLDPKKREDLVKARSRHKKTL